MCLCKSAWTAPELCQFSRHVCMCVCPVYSMCMGVFFSAYWKISYTLEVKEKCVYACVIVSQYRLSVKVRVQQSFFPTWDMFSPADVHHQLSVCQVTQRSQGLDVAVWYCWVWHGVNLLWLGHQQVRDDFVICKAAKGNWHDHQTRRKTQRQRDGEFFRIRLQVVPHQLRCKNVKGHLQSPL